jgi:hypothetical protein
LANALPKEPKIKLLKHPNTQIEENTRIRVDGIPGSLLVRHSLPLAVVVHNDKEYSTIELGLGPGLGIGRSDKTIRIWEENQSTPRTTARFRSFWDTVFDLDTYVAETEELNFAVYRLAHQKPNTSNPLGVNGLEDFDQRFSFEEVQQESLPKALQQETRIWLKSAPILPGLLSTRHVWNRVAQRYFAVLRMDPSGKPEIIQDVTFSGQTPRKVEVGDYVVLRNIRFNKRDLRLQDALLAAAFHDRPEAKSITPGHFDRSFPNLNRYLLELGSTGTELDMDSLGPFLDRDLERGTSPVEIVGIKIQAASLSLWGLLVLIGIQLYFVVHLSSCLSQLKNDQAPPIAWIGFYPGWPAQSLLIIGIMVLPAVVAGFTVYGALFQGSGNWIHGALGGGAITVALATFFPVRSLIRNTKPAG